MKAPPPHCFSAAGDSWAAVALLLLVSRCLAGFGQFGVLLAIFGSCSVNFGLVPTKPEAAPTKCCRADLVQRRI